MVTGLLMLLVVFSGVAVVTVLVVDAGLVVDWCDEGDGLLDDAIVEDSAGTVTATAVVDGSAEVEVVALAGALVLTVSPEVGATPQAETPTNRHAVRAASARRMSPR